MTSLNWLHISDLHMGLSGQDNLWPNIEREFLRDIQTYHKKLGGLDVVFFTGDLVQSGQRDEYVRLSGALSRMWSLFDALGNRPCLIPIPGNHDMLRPVVKGKPISASLRVLLNWHNIPDFYEEIFQPGNEYAALLSHSFENYSRWCSDELPKFQDSKTIVSMQSGVIPGDFSATIAVGDRRVGVVGLNSAFMQLDGGNFMKRLALFLQQLHAVCPNISSWEHAHHVRFLLTHHPITWLHPQIIASEWPEIAPAGRFDFHLFGHMHENRSKDESFEGGPTIRSWQSSSLFGMEHYLANDGTTQLAREHGYQFGQLEFSPDGGARVRQFPRTATLHKSNGWAIHGDTGFGRLGDDGATSFRLVELMRPDAILATVFVENPIEGRYSRHSNDSETQKMSAILARYSEAISKIHGFIRFVEIPHLQDLSDVAISQLYITPEASPQQIFCDWPANRWGERADVLSVLSKCKKLVLLGDPGFGKSTLVSYLSWLMCSGQQLEANRVMVKGPADLFLREVKGVVPVPIILREMQLQADLTWESLIDTFVLNQPLGQILETRGNLEALMAAGRVFVMLDGIDEISNITVRNRLRAAVVEGMTAYPLSRWLLTSRVVGYEEVPFDSIPDEPSVAVLARGEVKQATSPRSKQHISTKKVCDKYFLAPFSDEKIIEFSTNWFIRHEADVGIANETTDDFVKAVSGNDGTKRLARIPFLLTLMSLLYHKNARLPHGRAELYEKIASAYLDSIDAKRKIELTHLPYSLVQKKQWLSRVAFYMQKRRAAGRKSHHFGSAEILASERLVQGWLTEAISDVGAPKPGREAKQLLDYFAERSGLFLPRGLKKFAFAHLSLQEYFAACYLEPKLTSSRFAEDQSADGPTEAELFSWANESSWRETFALLFEILAQRGRKHTEAFLQFLFSEERLTGPSSSRQDVAVQLLSEVIIDPFTSITASTRSQMKGRCWRWVFESAVVDEGAESVEPVRSVHAARAAIARTLLSEYKGDLRSAWDSAGIRKEDVRKLVEFSLNGCTSLTDVSPIVDAKSLTVLSLDSCHRVVDIGPLGTLTKLHRLSLWGCDAIRELGVLSKLSKLKVLRISVGSLAGSLAPLHSLKDLTFLSLRCFDGSVDLEELSVIKALRVLVLEGVSDPDVLRRMTKFTALREIHIHDSELDLDLGFLDSMAMLTYVCTAGSPKVKVPRRLEVPF